MSHPYQHCVLFTEKHFTALVPSLVPPKCYMYYLSSNKVIGFFASLNGNSFPVDFHKTSVLDVPEILFFISSNAISLYYLWRNFKTTHLCLLLWLLWKWINSIEKPLSPSCVEQIQLGKYNSVSCAEAGTQCILKRETCEWFGFCWFWLPVI